MTCKDLDSLIEKTNQEINTHINSNYFKCITKEKAIENLIRKYNFIITDIYCDRCSKISTCEYYLKKQYNILNSELCSNTNQKEKNDGK